MNGHCDVPLLSFYEQYDRLRVLNYVKISRGEPTALDGAPGDQRPDPHAPETQLHVHQQRIPTVPSIRILGLRLQQNGRNAEILKQLDRHVHQTTRFNARIANRPRGMKENMICLVITAYALSRIPNVAPFLSPSETDTLKLNTMIEYACTCR